MTTLGVWGCGLMGSSAALAFRAAGVVSRVVGWDRDAGVAARAQAVGALDAVAPSPDALAAADVVLLAIPTGGMGDAARVLAAAGGAAIITDVGSSKAQVVARCTAYLGARFVGGHPMAGSERAGPEAASGELFRGRRVFLTPTERTSPDAVARIAALWHGAGARVEQVAPETHDAIVARLSHGPHVAAAAVVRAAGAGAELVGRAGPGFRDVTRVAASPPEFWVDTLLGNREPVLEAIDSLRRELAAVAALVTVGDTVGLHTWLAEAGRIRAALFEEGAA